jgi:hypothetical protein
MTLTMMPSRLHPDSRTVQTSDLAKLNAKHSPLPMAKGPRGERRPADAIGAAVMVGRIATGEIIEKLDLDDGKKPAAVALGRMGGKARAEGVSAKRRKEIARKVQSAGGVKPRFSHRRAPLTLFLSSIIRLSPRPLRALREAFVRWDEPEARRST